ncbi:7 transmembrane receptor (rhodopsin family) domain-containing protein [Ditylenchus destructor]|nr:7 transmembrane receptor (rhodopsin family) domain-containing protein [Ditylenchus destructor]
MATILTIIYILCTIVGIVCNSIAKFIIATTKKAFADSISIFVFQMIFLSLSEVRSSFIRFVEILSPILHDKWFNTRISKVYVAVLWICSLIFSYPYLLYFRVQTAEPSSIPKCYATNFREAFWNGYNLARVILTFVLPLLLCGAIFGVSSFLLLLLNRLTKDTASTTNSKAINSGLSVLIGLRKQTIKLLAVSIFMFILGYAPSAVEIFLFRFHVELAAWMHDAKKFLLILSVSLCPFTFARFSYLYQQRFRQIKSDIRKCIGGSMENIFLSLFYWISLFVYWISKEPAPMQDNSIPLTSINPAGL